MTASALIPHAEFNDLADLALKSLSSADSARVYGQTYRLWLDYCQNAGTSPLDLMPGNVLDFIASQDTTKATRQRQLSAMRKLAQWLYVLRPDENNRRLFEALKLVKAPVGDGSSGQERTRRALTPAQADRLLRAWGENIPQHRRNRALVAVLLLSGIRRSEAAALRWADVDFENGVLHVRHGKGDKRRDVPLAGDFALEALRAWQLCQPSGYEYMFTPVLKGNKVGADKPVTGTDVYRIVRATEGLAGVEFKPHDCRRTFITEALATGTPIATVQAAAGHARGDTTLRYAQAVDARRARRELKLRYG